MESWMMISNLKTTASDFCCRLLDRSTWEAVTTKQGRNSGSSLSDEGLLKFQFSSSKMSFETSHDAVFLS